MSRYTALSRTEVLTRLRLDPVFFGFAEKASFDGKSLANVRSRLLDTPAVLPGETDTAPTMATFATDPLFLLPLLTDEKPEALIECRRLMQSMSLEGWFSDAPPTFRHIGDVVLAIGLISRALSECMIAYACSDPLEIDKVAGRLVELAYHGLEEDVAKRRLFAVAFAAALAAVGSRLGFGAICLWANSLLLSFVPGGLRRVHAEAGDELAGADLMLRLRQSVGDRIADQRYQLVWRLKQPTSVVSNLLRMLSAGGESRSGLPQALAHSAGVRLLIGHDSSVAHSETYNELLFDHFACTIVLMDKNEPTDYHQLSDDISFGSEWTVLKSESAYRQAYHRRLFLILEHLPTRRPVELLVKSNDAFLVGRAYQWTARGSRLCASAGPFADGHFDWSEAATRIHRAGSIVHALVGECGGASAAYLTKHR
ncbi:MAG: hypothetical protein QOC81_3551 [Thermoanaerobaculia bacterium]|nr:hypothetical protein [Thermoanaerobaculia bacterium]